MRLASSRATAEALEVLFMLDGRKMPVIDALRETLEAEPLPLVVSGHALLSLVRELLAHACPTAEAKLYAVVRAAAADNGIDLPPFANGKVEEYAAWDATATVVLITGPAGVGKTSVGRLLARRVGGGAHIDGDAIGALHSKPSEDRGLDPTDASCMRHHQGANLAETFFAAGVAAIHSDVIVGNALRRYPLLVKARPLRIVMLYAREHVIADRERARWGSAYPVDVDGHPDRPSIRALMQLVDSTPRLGLWIDTSDMSPPETVDEILRCWDNALVPF